MPEVYHRPVPRFILFLRRGPARCHLAVFCPIRRSRSTRPICSLFWEMSAREQELHVPVRVNSRWSTRNSSGAKLSTWSPHAGLVVNAYQAGPRFRSSRSIVAPRGSPKAGRRVGSGPGHGPGAAPTEPGNLRRRGEISCAFRPKPLAHAGGSARAF